MAFKSLTSSPDTRTYRGFEHQKTVESPTEGIKKKKHFENMNIQLRLQIATASVTQIFFNVLTGVNFYCSFPIFFVL